MAEVILTGAVRVGENEVVVDKKRACSLRQVGNFEATQPAEEETTDYTNHKYKFLILQKRCTGWGQKRTVNNQLVLIIHSTTRATHPNYEQWAAIVQLGVLGLAQAHLWQWSMVSNQQPSDSKAKTP